MKKFYLILALLAFVGMSLLLYGVPAVIQADEKGLPDLSFVVKVSELSMKTISSSRRLRLKLSQAHPWRSSPTSPIVEASQLSRPSPLKSIDHPGLG